MRDLKWIAAPAARRNWALLVTTAAILAAHPSFAADPLAVTLDQATVVKLPEKIATIIVGNPLIADVTVQSSGMMVVTGKSYGVTNVMALDRGGGVLLEREVQVRGPNDGVIIVYRGADRESYSCVPNCEQRITLGDNQKYFDAVLNQSVSRTGQASGGGAAPAAAAKP